MPPLEERHRPLPLPPIGLLAGASLFLDFDGTLVDIAPTPNAVAIDEPLRELLSSLFAGMSGRLAIISGRSIGELERLFGRLPFIVGGSHGLELRWPDGRITAAKRTNILDVIVAEVAGLKGEYPGVLIEEKPFGIAVHFRAEPRAEAACRELVSDLARRSGLSLQTGKMVYELRVPGADKGTALRQIMTEMGDTVPIYIGDDDTDEAAFAAATELGGAGIRVHPDRPTAARYRLDSVVATRAWLHAANEAIS